MKTARFAVLVISFLAVISGVLAAQTMVPTAPLPTTPTWQLVVNNGMTVPGDTRVFNSFNQPSINLNRVVVFRGRSKGGDSGEPAHGVYMRDMKAGTALTTVFDRNTVVPNPNNQGSTFIEPPSFPRIDMRSNTIASRANHEPVWQYALDPNFPDVTTKAGTTGIYTNPFSGKLISGANNLGGVPEFGFYAVPLVGVSNLKFDVFPGAPAVSNKTYIAFKGNFTNGTTSGTGVYYRNLADTETGGSNPAVLVADTTTLIPGTTNTYFGSTAPPSAEDGKMVFTGLDNEDDPDAGGIYLAPMKTPVKLTTLVKIHQQVPGEATGVGFDLLGEGLSFDGRFVGFWGAWKKDTESKSLNLICPADGNKDLIAECLKQYPGGHPVTVPVHQGVFVFDTKTSQIYTVAKTPTNYDDFMYWNFSGHVTGTGESEEESGEPPRWRSAAFVAVSGLVDGSLTDSNFHVAFKGRRGTVDNLGQYANPMDGIYVRRGPGDEKPFVNMVVSGTDGTLIDSGAVYVPEDIPDPTPVHLPVTAMGIERDGFRGNSLVVNVSMANADAGWAGIYLTTIPK